MSEISQLQINNTTYDIVDTTARSGLFPGLIQMFAGSALPSGWLLCDGSAVSRTTYAKLFAAIGTAWGTGDGSTTFNLPDLRGRAPIGAGTGSGLTARTLGGKTGAETVTLATTQIPGHTHTYAKSNASTGSTTLKTTQIPAHTHGSKTLTGGVKVHAFGSSTDSPIMWDKEGIVNIQSTSSTAYDRINAGGTTASAYHKFTITATHTHDSVGGGEGHDHSISTTSTASGSTGGGSAHNNMQPSAVVNFIIYAG